MSGCLLIIGVITIALIAEYTEIATTVIGIIILIAISIPIFLLLKAIIDKWVEEENRKEREKQEKERQKRQEEERKRQQKEQYKQQQQQYYQTMIDLDKRSLYIFEELPGILKQAEKNLDQAERDFTDNALSPFWDSIEEAIQKLATFNEKLYEIERNISEYESLTTQYEGKSPDFTLSRNSISSLNVSNSTSKRLQTLVRKAQRNYEFASIYEQRKTNQILVAGFNNLSDAIRDMTSKITSSINKLSKSMDSVSSKIEEVESTVEARAEKIEESAENKYKEMKKETSERKTKEKKALEMLEDIHHMQRRKHIGY